MDTYETQFSSISKRQRAYEFLLIVAFVAIYSLAFKMPVPTGDGYRNAVAIAAGEVAINPNHLLFEPVLYLATWCLETIGLGHKPFLAAHIISSIGGVITLLLFVRFLRTAGIKRDFDIYLATAGLAASHAFLFQILDDETYLIQLPFVLLALTSIIQLTDKNCEWSTGGQLASVKSGAYLSIACLISIHNVILAALLVPFVYFKSAGINSLRAVITYASSGLFVVVVALGLAYFYVDPDTGIFQWLVTYQTDSDSAATLWTTEFSAGGLIVAFVKVLTAIPNAIIEDPGFAHIARELLFRTGDFSPNVLDGVVGAFLVAASSAAVAGVLFLATIHRSRRPVIILCFVTIGAYALFGMFWNVRAPQFWVPCLIAFWPLLAIVLDEDPGNDISAEQRLRARGHIVRRVAVTFIITAFLGNSLISIAPNSLADPRSLRDEYRSIVSTADVLIVPGWDFSWMLEVHREVQSTNYYLMDMGLQYYNQPKLEELATIVENHLNSGDVVYVTRLFDIDNEQKPWPDLRQIGWPRDKLQDSLRHFCAQPVGQVDDIVIRQIRFCE